MVQSAFQTSAFDPGISDTLIALIPKTDPPAPSKTLDPLACEILCISLPPKSWFTVSDRSLMLLLIPTKAVFCLVEALLTFHEKIQKEERICGF